MEGVRVKSTVFTVAVALVVAWTCGGCLAYSYRALVQSPVPSAALATTPSIYFYPPEFAQLARPENYEDDATWRIDVADIQAEWLEQVPAYAAEEGLAPRVHTLHSGEYFPPDGIGVGITVVDLRDETDGFTFGGYLFLTADVVFADAGGKVLFQARVEATSEIRRPFIGWRSITINGRIALASWNLITAALRALRSGSITPVQG